MADDEGFGSLNSRRPAVKISDRSGQLSHEGNKGTKGRGFRQDNEDGRYSGQVGDLVSFVLMSAIGVATNSID